MTRTSPVNFPHFSSFAYSGVDIRGPFRATRHWVGEELPSMVVFRGGLHISIHNSISNGQWKN
jgi:hypothetical protein